jgi:hypothetical protein
MPKKLSLPFEEYNYEQRRLSKHFQKRKPAYKGDIAARTIAHYCRKVVFVMGPNEVVANLAILGINVTSETVRNYVKWGLIPTPFRKSLGRGKGRISIYPEETPEEFYASYCLVHRVEGIKLSPKLVAPIRKAALCIEKSPELVHYMEFFTSSMKRNGIEKKAAGYIQNGGLPFVLIFMWLHFRTIAVAILDKICGEFNYYVDDDGNITKNFIPGSKTKLTFKTSSKFKEEMEASPERRKDTPFPIPDISRLP